MFLSEFGNRFGGPRRISAPVFYLLAIAITAVRAQTPGSESFDSLGREATAAIDTDPVRAASLLQKALKLRPAWSEGRFYLGGALYGQKRYREALASFRQGLAISPQNGNAWAFQGLCEYELGSFDKALSDIYKGEQIGLGTNTAFESSVRVHAALILIRFSFFDRATAQLNPLSRYHDDSTPVIEAVGLCALAIPRMVTALAPEKREVVKLAGEAMWARTCNRLEESKLDFDRLLKSYPNEPGVHYAHAVSLLELEPHAAFDELQNELSANPDHWPSLLASSFLAERQGKPEAAFQFAQRALKSVPAAFRWLCDADGGQALLAMGESQRAIPFLEESIKLEPGVAEIHFYLLQAYRRVGRKADAQKEQTMYSRIRARQDAATPMVVLESR